ncbi:MAG: ribonuclease III [Oscillospiraceae bacterium]|jgi:ribonuclease-3|nr:ribonuclease III [Oscillospiraceae bacterium]MCR5806215.1 ribonuclease III [Oscillospiraceae bacterium]
MSLLQEYEPRLTEFESLIGYTFKNKKLLFEALSHSSFVNEVRKGTVCNERLEFLGDSVLSIVVSDHLFRHFHHLPEGDLTKIRASLVNEKALFAFSKRIELGRFILLGRGEDNTGGRERPSIISDAFEAVIAAIYLDGGIEAAREYILGFIPTDLTKDSSKSLQDYKTMLQEVIQQNPEEKVEYALCSESGPDHNKSYDMNVLLNGAVIGHGTGHTKKQAEQQAAKEALELMGVIK